MVQVPTGLEVEDNYLQKDDFTIYLLRRKSKDIF